MEIIKKKGIYLHCPLKRQEKLFDRATFTIYYFHQLYCSKVVRRKDFYKFLVSFLSEIFRPLAFMSRFKLRISTGFSWRGVVFVGSGSSFEQLDILYMYTKSFIEPFTEYFLSLNCQLKPRRYLKVIVVMTHSQQYINPKKY